MATKTRKTIPLSTLDASYAMTFPAVVSTDKSHIKFAYRVEEGAEPDVPKIPTFWSNAYNGGPVDVEGWDYPLIVDLKGMTFVRQDCPVRLQHDANKGVGHTERITIEGSERPWLSISGVISRKTKYAKDVIESADAGFPWSTSIGAVISNTQKVPKGESVEVNGQTHVGPLFVGRKSVLKELSFVDLGADHYARGYVAAQSGFGEFFKGDSMSKKKGQLEAGNDPSPDDSSEGEQVLEAQVDDGDTGDGVVDDTQPKPKAPKGGKARKVQAADTSADDFVADHRKKVAAEIERTNAIMKVCEGKHNDIQAKAIAEGWTSEHAELEVQKAELKSLRESRPNVAIHVNGGTSLTGDVIEAAIALSGQIEKPESHYPEKVLEAANERFRHGIGLQEALLEAARANGYSSGSLSFASNPRGILQASFAGGQSMQASGDSFINIGGIMSNVANKFLLQGFMGVEQVWRKIAAKQSVRDFKQITSYRLTGAEMYKKIAPGGEIRHGDLGEESFTNQADTYGLMLSVSRTNIINDDLGALTSVPRKLGRGAGLKINDVFWTAFLDDASFFSGGNSNLITSVLGITGLTAAEKAFFELEDPEGNPLGVMPKILLVPPALNAVAKELYNSTEIWPATGADDKPTGNPHQGSYEPVMSAYLKAEDADWYLLAAPSDLPVIEICFLNGQESPTIESAEANFNTLGIQFRGYHDFGVAKQDYRGGVKSAP